MKEVYHVAIEQIKARCKEHLAKFGEHPSALGVDASTFEILRSGQHANRDATQIVVHYTIEAPPDVGFTLPALWFVVVMKEEKPA